MACCTRYCAAEKKFDSKVAERDLRRYRRRGPNGITRLLVSELRLWPLEGAELLDIGGGIGVICAELADKAAAATLVEASPAYLEVARRAVLSRFAERAQFVQGDFVSLAETLPDADVATLDRVVCCYPDAEALLGAAAARARRLVAFTYPRDRWYMRGVTRLQNFLRRLKGSEFRTFVHPPQRMRAVLEATGLVHAAQSGTIAWALDLYRRPDVA
jgi:2-polyprenyl-3-methyl-5-hydroxy-6-metoxy-1,4-benzoquinol methylase